MKIQSILNIKTQSFAKHNKINNFPLINQTDSVSFKGKVLTYEELRPLKMRAWQVQNESIEHKKEAVIAKDEAYEKLAIVKDEFIQALKYCNYYKKNPTKTKLKLPNGNILKFQFEYKLGKLTLEIEELNQEEAVIKTISAVNFIPTKIIDMSDNSLDVYEFSGNEVIILENLGVDGSEFGTCDTFTSFRNGKLNTISKNGNVAKQPSEFEGTYVYFDDKLSVYSSGNIVNKNGTCKSDERFVYLDESFSNYYSGFKGNLQGGMSFDESLHWQRGKFIGAIYDGMQKTKNEDIISHDATFLNEYNEFIHSKNCHARLSDFGLPIFADFEN